MAIKNENGGLSAKELALRSKVFASVLVVMGMLGKFIFKVSWVETHEIISVGVFIIASFGDISVSKWLEKIPKRG